MIPLSRGEHMSDEFNINKNSRLYKALEELNEEKIKEFIESECDENSEYFRRCKNITLKTIEKEFGKEAVKKFLENDN